MKTGKIKFIDRDGTFKDMNIFKVFMSDDSKYNFFTKSQEFKHKIGDEIKFTPKVNDSGEETGTASLVRDNPGGFTNTFSNGSPDLSRKIERQTVIKAVGERFSGAKVNKDVELEWANDMFNWINEAKSE